MTSSSLHSFLDQCRDALVVLDDAQVTYANAVGRQRFGEGLMGALVQQDGPQLRVLLPAGGPAISGRLCSVGSVQIGILDGIPETQAWLERCMDFSVVVSGVVHELSNPLSFISFNAQILGELLDDVVMGDEDALEEAESCAQDLLEGARRLETLTQDLRYFSLPSGMQAGASRTLDAVTKTALELCRSLSRSRVQLSTQLDAATMVAVPPGWMLRVIFALVHNAALSFPSLRSPIGTVQITTSMNDTHAVFAIADSGPGVPPELGERIYAPFFSARGSAGLGLSMARSVIERYGGQLVHGPGPLGGACFTVTVPRAVDSTRASSLPPVSGQRLLVVEPDSQRRKMLQHMLTDQDISAVSSVSAAVALLGAGEPIDGVVCSAGMAEEAVLRQHLQQHPHLQGRTLWLGGDVQRLPRQRVLPEPFEQPELLAAISQLTAGR